MAAKPNGIWFAESKLLDNLTVGNYNRREGMKLKSRLFHKVEIVFRAGVWIKWYYSVGKTEPFSWLRRGA